MEIHSFVNQFDWQEEAGETVFSHVVGAGEAGRSKVDHQCFCFADSGYALSAGALSAQQPSLRDILRKASRAWSVPMIATRSFS